MTDQTINDPASPSKPPTEAEVARALEWSLNTQPRRRRDGDEAIEVALLARVPSVAADLADRAPDPEVLKLTAIRILEARLEMLPTADQAVARILLEFHTPIADRNEQIGALARSTKTLPLRDQTIYRMSAVLLDRDRATVENLEVPETPEIASRRFRIGVAIGVASLVLGAVAILLAVYTDFLRDEATEDASVSLRFELSVDECDIATSCNSEANAVTALVAGFTPGGFADVRIVAPSGVDANELSAESPGYGYRTPLEVNDDGSFLWQYWWDPPMVIGTYEIEITDRETNRVATNSMTFLDSQASVEIDNDAPTNDEAIILYATILGESPLNVRTQPTTESEIAGTVEVGSRVTVTCYARGELVTLDSSDPGNDLWHLIVGPGPDSTEGYATDLFLNTPTGAEPLEGEPACAETVVADHAILTLKAPSGGPTVLASFEAGSTIQGQLVGSSTAQPAGVTNTFVQISGPGQLECMWDTAQRLEAGVLGIESDPNRNFLFVIEQIRNDEIDIRVYDVRGDLGFDEEDDEKGCRKLGVLDLDTPVPDWLEPAPPPP